MPPGGPFLASKEPPLVLGHRGASADAPENTMAAFRLAVEQGADGFELDVWRCASGEVIVHHDRDARRTGGEAVSIARTSLGALRRLDVGAWKGERFRGERLPTLREVLEAFPDALVNIELKSAGWPDLGLARAVAAALREARARERCIVSSFDAVLLAAFRAHAPEVASGFLFAEDRGWRLREAAGTRLLWPSAVHPQWTLITPERAASWARRGLAVNAWTVDAPEAIARLARMGVRSLITNVPGMARRVLRRAPDP